MLDTISRRIVGAVRAGHRQKTWISGIALGLTLVVAVGYLLIGALRVNPFVSTYKLRVQLADSGGLLANQDVAVRGVPVGSIQDLVLTPQGVDALVEVKSKVKIPVGTPVRVSGLSPAGEQYIDFEPKTTDGPYLANGDVIAREDTQTPVPLSDMLAHTDGALAQVDIDKLEIIKHELSLSKDGPQKLTDIIDGGTFLLATLNGVLPETVSVLKSSRVTLELLADKNAGLQVAADNLHNVLTGVNKMDGGYRTFVDQGPGMLSRVDGIFDDNSDTMVGLLENLATTAQILYLRVPALNALFPDYRGSTLEALGSMMHDQGLWATVDLYPTYACEYGTPRRPGSAADYPEPFLYSGYCPDTDPEVLIRGAKNAPRPAGDDTAGAPHGADLSATSDPTPQGRYSIPTPYGGPTLPIEPPR